MTRDDALNLDEALRSGDVSRAWSVWSSAAEAALADAYKFAGGPVLDRGLVLGRGSLLVRTVRLGGPEVRVKSTSPVIENHYKNGYVNYKNFIMTNEDNNHDTKYTINNDTNNHDTRDMHE